MPFRRRTRVACLLLVGCVGVLACFRKPDPAVPPLEVDPAAMRELVKLGDGLLVWERHLGGYVADLDEVAGRHWR